MKFRSFFFYCLVGFSFVGPQPILASVYECLDVIENYGAEIEIEKLVVNYGTFYSTINMSFSKRRGGSGLSYSKTDNIGRWNYTRPEANTIRFTKSESIGPSLQARWGIHYKMYDLDLENLTLKFHSLTVYNEQAPYNPGKSLETSYFVARCIKQ